MLIDGEKWACEACVRGHRVSNCNHFERPLTHINKKGRPVSQCPHCRGLRKARSSHVKCECGDKPHSKAECGSPDKLKGTCCAASSRASANPPPAGQKSPCCCTHGSTCTCALKKDQLGTIQELAKPSLTRSRSQTESSRPVPPIYHTDAHMTVFHNGHHKPVHHRNHAGHECGMPYKIPRPHSIHGSNTLAQVSTDSLPLLSAPYDLIADDRMARSEHGSPALPPRLDLLNQLPQLDLTYGALNTDIASSVGSPLPDDLSQPPTSGGIQSYFTSMDDCASLQALSPAPVDWAAMDLPLDPGNLPVDYNRARSFNSFDQAPTSHPGMTSSAGDISDAEDYMGSVQSPNLYAGSPFPQSAPEGNNVMGSYNMSSDSLGMPPTSMSMSNPPIDRYVTSSLGSPRDFAEYPHPDHDELSKRLALAEMQKLGHHGLGIDTGRGPSPPSFRPTSDPSWAGPFISEEQNFMPTSAPFQQQAPWTSC